MDHDEIMELMAETIQERRNAISATRKSTQDHEKSEFGNGYSIIDPKDGLDKVH